MVRKYTDIELIEIIEKLPTFKGWFTGIYDIWVRSNEDVYNQFDDKVYTFECAKDNQRPRFIMVCTGTSNAGAQGLKLFDSYNALGCAVLKSDTIVYNSHAFGKHRGQYDAYIQNKSFPYYRDNDKDNKSEELGKEYTNIIGANCHRAGQNSTQIDGWSLACLVRNQRKQYDAWLVYMNKRPLSVAIIKET